MKQRKDVISHATIVRRNTMAVQQITRIKKCAEDLINDPEKSKRLGASLCLCCYYVNNQRIGGASMTSKPCGICESDMQFGSTATDSVCESCAKAQGICKQCGADIELKTRRKPYSFQNKE